MNNHAIMLVGRVISLLEAFRMARVPPINALLRWVVRRILGRASATGDYFVYAGAQKYLCRLKGLDGEDSATETYSLLRDPLNYAIVRRDAGVRMLGEGR
jgi:hypothetical protein